jgi:DNA-binding MarR family transcriptional regulator
MPSDAHSIPASLADQLGFLSSKVHHRFHTLGNEALRPLGLNVKHYGLLTVIAAEGPIPQGLLGEIVRIDRTTMVAFVDALERKGLVNRTRNPDDRRAYALSVTAEGRKLQKQAAAAMKEAQAAVVEPLGKAERRELQRLLRVLVEAGPAPSE